MLGYSCSIRKTRFNIIVEHYYTKTYINDVYSIHTPLMVKAVALLGSLVDTHVLWMALMGSSENGSY